MKTKLEIQVAQLTKALARLEETLALPSTSVNRDATIQRFEFSFELSWKILQTIGQKEGQDIFGMTQSIRAGAQLGLIDDPEQWLDFRDARNLSTHLYDEPSSIEVYGEAKKFLPQAKNLLEKVKKFPSLKISNKIPRRGGRGRVIIY